MALVGRYLPQRRSIAIYFSFWNKILQWLDIKNQVLLFYYISFLNNLGDMGSLKISSQ
jgi:hypothetical protein